MDSSIGMVHAVVHRFIASSVLRAARMVPMNILPIEKQLKVIAHLVEGCSIRATARLVGVHRDTVMDLGARIGDGCRQVHDRLFCNLNVAFIQLDELWSYVRKKQKRVTAGDGPEVGDQYVFTALDPISRSLLTAHVGKRDMDNTVALLKDLHGRILNHPQISADAFTAYPEAIASTFGTQGHFAQVTDTSDQWPRATSPRQRPSQSAAVEKKIVWGEPDRGQISTSLIERSNLTVRQHSRRFTRLTNGFSKNLQNHRSSIHLFVAYYNLCRVHSTLRTTPAKALGVTDQSWTLEELVHAAGAPDDVPARMAPFTLIRCGLS
jgi:IS1 family transposase